jgi:acyl-CoA synthetase (AMP-forming)/AMP-acid ligase II
MATSGSPMARPTLVNAVAAWLAAQGVKPGDRVAVAMRNYPEWMLIYWACVSTGIAVVGMNAWWTAEEMAYGLADSAPKVLFLDAERLAAWERAAATCRADARRRALPNAPAGGDALERGDRTRRRDAGRGDRSRCGCLHLLHLGHHRLSQGRAAHPARLHHQPDEHALCRRVDGAGDAARDRRRAARPRRRCR